MKNKLHIELLAKESSHTEYNIREHSKRNTDIDLITIPEALSALQALETALTEKHRAEVEKLKNYAQHKAWCDGANVSFCGEPCTCGLDQLLTTNPKEERK